jgi:hypothetical protein
MKQLSLFACIFLLFGILSCDKKEEIINEEYPSWLIQSIAKMKQSFSREDLCTQYYITTMEYKGKRYYRTWWTFSSCSNCNLYDQYGNTPSWDSDTTQDFWKNVKFIKEETACALH